MPDCPSEDDLAGFLNESLPPDRVAGLAGHVDSCPSCQTRLDKLTHDTGGAVARYKELSSVIRVSEGSLPSGGVASSPEAGTLIVGKNQLPLPLPSARPTGLPLVPGFDVVAEIGRGGMGVVYKARHRRLNRLCALKMILAGGAADTRTVQRFLFEAEVLARVQHAQVVQVFEVDTYQGPSGVPVPYLAMELLEGGSLSKRVRQRPLPARAAAELMDGVARAVHSAHLQGVVHRDLKPGNILFPDGSGEIQRLPAPEKTETGKRRAAARHFTTTPKVTDFGLAKFSESTANLTGSGQVVGTPHYMAPEQAAGSKQVGPAADVYSLGALLFECLTGRPPFEGGEPMSVLLKVVNESPPDVRTLRPDVPRDLAAVVARCLDKTPGRRYQSAAELADDLRRFLEDRPTVARPLRRRERLWRWMRRNPAVSGLAVALLVVLLVAFVIITRLWLRAESTASDERRAREFATQSERRAVAAFEDANRARQLADQRQAELEFHRAIDSCEEGRVRDGLRSFVRVVELAEQLKDADLARAARVNLAAWPRELAPSDRRFAHTDQPRLAAFPDADHMVTVGAEEEAYLWDLKTGERERVFKAAPPSGLRPPAIVPKILPLPRITRPSYCGVSVGPDGRTIAVGGSDGRVTVWDRESEAPRLWFVAADPGEDVWSVGFTPDGILWTANRGGLRAWNVSGPKQQPVAQLNPKPGGKVGIMNVLVVAPDGKRIYTGDRAGVLREWDAEKREEARRWETGAWIQDLAVSPAGDQVAYTGPVGKARVFDLAAARVVLEVDLASAYGNGVAFAPRRPYLLTTDGDGNVRFWHRQTGQPVCLPLRLSGDVTRLRFRPDSNDFAAPAGGAVHVCGLPDPPGDLISPGLGHRCRGIDFSPGGERLAVTHDSGIEVFDPHTLKRVHFAERPGGDPLTLRFDRDPSRQRVFRGTRDGFDWLQLPDGVRTHEVAIFGMGRIRRVEVSPRGSALLVMGENMVARYDPLTLERTAVERVQDTPAGSSLDVLAVRPDGGELLVGSGRRVAFLHPETLKPVRPGWTAGDELLDARYSPKGDRVLVGRRDNVAELLDAATGRPLVRPMVHERAVTSVAVSPDGGVLLTGSRDGTSRFWDATSGLPLGAPLRHLGPVTHVAFAPNGEHVATGTGTGHVMLWDVPPKPAAGSLEELRAKYESARE